jgi:cyclic beta-1,2-glucan synthetase
VDTLREVLERRFPDNALLSHDLIEGAYARVALVSDIELVDDYPSHFSAYSRRKHRWMRGDWQIMRWTRVPRSRFLRADDFQSDPADFAVEDPGQSAAKPARAGTGIAFVKRLAVAAGTAGILDRGDPLMWFVPAFSGLFFALLRVPRTGGRCRRGGSIRSATFRESVLITMCSLIFLLHQALISLDAIVRSVGRVW